MHLLFSALHLCPYAGVCSRPFRQCSVESSVSLIMRNRNEPVFVCLLFGLPISRARPKAEGIGIGQPIFGGGERGGGEKGMLKSAAQLSPPKFAAAPKSASRSHVIKHVTIVA